MPRNPDPHGIIERGYTAGFQPRRWIVCRCGWRSPVHYNRGETLRFHRIHREVTMRDDREATDEVK